MLPTSPPPPPLSTALHPNIRTFELSAMIRMPAADTQPPSDRLSHPAALVCFSYLLHINNLRPVRTDHQMIPYHISPPNQNNLHQPRNLR